MQKNNINFENFLDLAKNFQDNKNSESPMKIFDSIKDRVNVNELLVKTILNKNTELVKYIIESYKLNVNNPVLINPALITKNESNVKDNLTTVNVPLIILVAISGSIDILNYFISLKADLKQAGHICISPKKKNSVISNIIGAAAYYGNLEFITYVLDLKAFKDFNNKNKTNFTNTNYTNELSVNYKTTEKKLKTSKMSQFSKEYSGLSPIMLAALNEDNHHNARMIYHKLRSFVLIDEKDAEGNTILHLATKANNEKLVRELVTEENLDFKIINSNGDNCFILAEKNNNVSISNFFASLEKSEETLQNNIYSLMEEESNNHYIQTHKGKKKINKKKNKNTDNTIIGFSNFPDQGPLAPQVIKNEKIATDEFNKAFDENVDVSDEEQEERYDNESDRVNSNTNNSIKENKENRNMKNNYNEAYSSNNNTNQIYSKYKNNDYTDYNNNYASNHSYGKQGYNKQGYNRGGYNNSNSNRNSTYNLRQKNYYYGNNSNYYNYSSNYNTSRNDYYQNYYNNNTNNNSRSGYYPSNQNYNSTSNKNFKQPTNTRLEEKQEKLITTKATETEYNDENNNTTSTVIKSHEEESRYKANDIQEDGKPADVVDTLDYKETQENNNSNTNENIENNENTNNYEETNTNNIENRHTNENESNDKDNTENHNNNNKISNTDNDNDGEPNETSINKLLLDDPLNNINLVNEQDMAVNTHYLDSLIVSKQ